MTKALVTSDWHGDHVTRGLSRFEDVRNAAQETVTAAIVQKCDQYFFLGDLADPDVNPYVVPRCVRMLIGMAMELEEAGIEFIAIPGNHDGIDDGSGTSTLYPLDAFGGQITLFDNPSISTMDNGWTLLALPYTPLSHTYDPAEYVKKTEDDLPLLVLSHLGVDGIQPGEETKDMPRGRDVLLPLELLKQRTGPTLILQGHYHARRVTPEGLAGKDVIIPGSLVSLTFGEEKNEPGYLIVEY